jgi:hypothetical protein
MAASVGEFGTALGEAAAAARALGQVDLPAELAAVVGALDPGQITPDLVASLAEGLGLGGDGGPLPDRQAMINTLLDAAPVPVREALFSAFLGLLQQPTY